MSLTVKLTVLTGAHRGERHELLRPTTYTLGRARECDVSLHGTAPDQFISRRHCQLHVDPPVVRIQDLCSRNGTFVNGQPVQAGSDNEQQGVHSESKSSIGTLQPGDIVTIGNTSLRVDVVGRSAPEECAAEVETCAN